MNGSRADGSVEEPPGSEVTAQAHAYADRLAMLADAARRSDQPGHQAAMLMEAQRVAAWGLRAAVSQSRSSGMSWRHLSGLLRVPAASLHRKFQAGGGLFPGGDMSECPLQSQIAEMADGSRSPDSVSPRLPELPLNLFVGRDNELSDLSRLVRRHRLVTVIGPVGVGKTRLALEIAHRGEGGFRGGVFWVPLAGVPARSDAQWISAAVQLDSQAAPLGSALERAARLGPVLLVVDNCEHVVAGAAELLHGLLARNPAVTVLATSREALEVPGEAKFRLEPFPVVPTDLADPWQAGSAAARVFADRAQLASHTVSLAGHERIIAEVCNALDGLPLAIELAAKQCAAMPVTALAARLGRQFDHGASQSGVHAGLRAAIAWSYDLLDPVEQALFRRLALLPDGVTEPTAAVLGTGLGLDRAGVWSLLGRLTAKSMLTTTHDQPIRFGMLTAIRAYGREQLELHGEVPATTELVVDWLTTCADEYLHNQLADGTQDLCGAAAFQGAVDVARRSRDPRYPRLALRFAALLWDSGDVDGAGTTVLAVFAVGNLPPDVEVRARVLMAAVKQTSGDLAAAVGYAHQALTIAREKCGGHVRYQAGMAMAMMVSDDPPRALAYAREQMAIVRAEGLRELLPGGLNNLAWYLLLDGRIEEAAAAVAEMLAVQDGPLLSEKRHTAGCVALAGGELQQASSHFVLGLDVTGSRMRWLILLEGLGCVAAAQREPERALRILAGCAAHRERYGYPRERWYEEQADAARAHALSQLPPKVAATAEAGGSRLTIQELVTYARDDIATDAASDTPLTERETAVAVLVARGYATKQIATRLRLAPGTVSAYIANSRAKLGLANRAELAAWTMRHHPNLITRQPGPTTR